VSTAGKGSPITDEQRTSTLARYERHRSAWASNPALRALYADWYGRISAWLPSRSLGELVEIGSGPGFAKPFIPELRLTDVVLAPWHDYEVSADHLPFEAGTVGGLVLVDVLHHLAAPAAFFDEAARVLAPGGRLVLCEPFMSPLSYPVFHFLHEEPVVMGVDPLAGVPEDGVGKDPFDSNQAIPTLLFARSRGRSAFDRRFPSLVVKSIEYLAGLSYPASGGFSRGPLLPLPLWRALRSVEDALPSWLYRLLGFRILVVIEKTPVST
jgi:SAM-dependent methyltransferase